MDIIGAQVSLVSRRMTNVSANASTSTADNVAVFIGITVTDGVLLLIVFFVLVLNFIVIAALIGKDNSELVLTIRVILINILAACVLGALYSVMYHIASPILQLTSSTASINGPPFCRAIVFFSTISSSGRVLFTAFYGVAVFISVHFWSRPVLAPRNTKYFIIASGVVWLLAVVTGIPALFDETVGGFCSFSSNSTQMQDTFSRFSLLVAVPYLAVSCIAIIVTPVILIETTCYIKRKTIREHRGTKNALVRFGLFMMIVQTFNAFSLVGIPLLTFGISSLQTEYPIAFIVGVALSDLSRIPTNFLILIFFKPVRVKVQRWLCCCCHYHKPTAAGNKEWNWK